MAQNTVEIVVRARNDAKAALRDVAKDAAAASREAKRSFADLNKSLKATGASMRSAGQKMSLALTLPLAAIGTASVRAASAAGEAASKAETVFGDAFDEMDAWITGIQDSIPASRAELHGMTADLAALGKALGGTPEQAKEMSKEFTVLAADLGSFNDVPVEEALAAIRSALVGSSEPMLRFGVDTRQTALEAKALEMGLIAEGEALDQSTRALVIATQIREQATDAMGDAERTAGSFANQTKFLKAGMADLAVTIGQQLLPILAPLIKEFAGFLQRLRETNPSLLKMGVIVGLVVAAVGPLLIAVGALATAIGAIGIPVAAAVIAIAAVGTAIGVLLSRSEGFRSAFSAVWSEAAETARVWAETIARLWQAHGAEIMAILGPILNQITTTIEAAMKLVVGIVAAVLAALRGDWSGAWEHIRGVMVAGEAFIAQTWENIKAIFAAVLSVIGSIVVAGFNAVKDHIVKTLTGARDAVVDLWRQIKAEFADRIREIVGMVEGFRDKVIAPFEKMREIIVGGSIVPDTWSQIKDATEAGGSAMTAAVEESTTNVAAVFDALFSDGLSRWLGNWGGFLQSALSALGDWAGGVGGILGKVGGFLSGIFGGGGGFGDLGGLFQEGGALAGIGGLFAEGGALGGLGGLFAKGGALAGLGPALAFAPAALAGFEALKGLLGNENTMLQTAGVKDFLAARPDLVAALAGQGIDANNFRTSGELMRALRGVNLMAGGAAGDRFASMRQAEISAAAQRAMDSQRFSQSSVGFGNEIARALLHGSGKRELILELDGDVLARGLDAPFARQLLISAEMN